MTPQEIARVLSEPIKINKLTLKNRVVMSPMAAHGSEPDGRPGDQTVAFFEARARGGVGMIIVGGSTVTERAWDEGMVRGLRWDVEAFLPDWKRVADVVHAQGVPIIAELMPGFGRMGTAAPGRQPISASPINVVLRSSANMRIPGGEMATPMPREATVAEIEAYEKALIDASVMAHRAGWDGVELPAIMSYFLSSFISPRTNWRTDQYGGSVENRARMLVNVVKGVRQRLGPDFVVGLRITANDYMPDGQGPEGFAAIAKEVEKAGIDYVALVYGCYDAVDRTPDADGANLIDNGDAKVFKQVLSVPVIACGVHAPERVAEVVAEGHGDLVMLARQMLADPDYARKVCEGRANEVVRCDRGNLCIRRMTLGMPIRCSVNPRMGLESRKPGALPPAERIVKVPMEQAMLGLTNSKWFMDMAGAVMKKRAKADEPVG